MNIEDFRYITTIADAGSFTRAAKQLFIAQPSLSQRVKHIEENYEAEFFTRDSRGISLTPAGECFVKHARQILECEQELRQELSDMHMNGENVLRIGICNLITTQFFDDLFVGFQTQYPNIRCDFTHQASLQLQQSLISGQIDIAICYLPIDTSKLAYETLFYDRFVLLPAVGSVLSKQAELCERDEDGCIDRSILSNAPFASGKKGGMLNKYLMRIVEELDAPPDIRNYTSNYLQLFALAKAGITSTILYESFFDSKQEYLPYYYLDGPDNDLAVALAWRKDGYLCKPAKKIINFVRGNIHEPI